MLKKLQNVLALSVVTAVAVSVTTTPASAQTADAGKVVTVTDRDNNETIDLNTGDTLVLRLTSNPSTGYSWRITQNNDALLAPQGQPAYVPAASGLIGAQGTQVFTFTAAATGGDALTLSYQRPNSGSQDANTFHLRAVISDPAAPAAKVIKLTDADNNSTVKATVGDTLSVQLAALPSAGFNWTVIDNATGVLKPAGSAVVRSTNRIGAGVTDIYTFTVTSTGEASLKMAYLRAGSGQTIRTWQVFVDVPAATTESSASASRAILANYACDNGVTFQATFGNDIASVTFNDETKTLKQQPAADGMDYADADWELREAGGKTTLTDLKTNKPLAENCVDQNAVTPQTPDTPPAITVTYTCRDNSTFQVVFDDNFATVTYDGQEEALSQAPEADGISYANPVWTLRGKGAMATLSDTATGKVIQQDCMDLSKTDAGQNAPVSFTCADGVTMTVLFGDKIATVTLGDETKKLPQVVSGDGYRYADAARELRGKGNEATLTDLATNKPVAQECMSQS